MARSCDGTSGNYLSVGACAPLDTSPGPFTVQVWFKPADLTQTNKYLISVGQQFDVIWEFVGDQVESYVPTFSGSDPRTSSGITLADTNWHHIVYRKTGSGAGAWDKFLDGTKTTINASISFTIIGASGGVFVFTSGNPLAGALAEVAVWQSALTDGNITSLAAGVRADTIGTPSHYWRIMGAADPEPEEMGTGKDLVVTGTLPQVTHPFDGAGPPPLTLVGRSVLDYGAD